MSCFSKTIVIFMVVFLLSAANFAQKITEEYTVPKVTQVDEVSIKEILKPNGKPLLINFWATWCVPCREEFPDLVKLDKEYKGKIDFITITLDDLAEIDRDVPKFLTEMKAEMPTYLLKTTDENGVISSISKDWEGGLPFTVLYDQNGGVVHTRQGKVRPENLRTKLNRILDLQKVMKAFRKLTDSNPFPAERYNFDNGINDAKADLRNGKYWIMTYGLIDIDTGKYRKKISDKHGINFKDFGCSINDHLIDYARGYNSISKPEIKRKFGLKL